MGGKNVKQIYIYLFIYYKMYEVEFFFVLKNNIKYNLIPFVQNVLAMSQ